MEKFKMDNEKLNFPLNPPYLGDFFASWVINNSKITNNLKF